MQTPHLGHTSWHPDLSSFCIGQRSKMYIFDTKWTYIYLSRALLFLRALSRAKGKILFVSTKPKYAPLVRFVAQTLGQSAFTSKWVGGTLTNWQQMHTNVSLTHSFLTKFGSFVEQKNLRFPKYIRSKRRFEYFSPEMPDALIVLNPADNGLALREARALSLPVIAFVDSSTSLENITYPIVSNDDSTEWMYTVLEKIVQAMRLE